MEYPSPILILLTLVTVFSFGALVGWLISNLSELTARTKMKVMVAVVISLGWISATVSGILLTSYSVSPLLHALMGAIVGYFFTEDGINFNVGK